MLYHNSTDVQAYFVFSANTLFNSDDLSGHVRMLAIEVLVKERTKETGLWGLLTHSIW